MAEDQQQAQDHSSERSYTDDEVRQLLHNIKTGADKLLTPGQVAKMCGVDPKTVTRWSKSGKLRALKLGLHNGHRRYSENEVHRAIFGLAHE